MICILLVREHVYFFLLDVLCVLAFVMETDFKKIPVELR